MIFARSLGGPQAAAEERTLNWEEVQQLFRTAFLTGTEVENSVPSAERLSPVAAAHRILTNSFGLIPFGLYRRDGEERVPVEDPALNQVMRVRANPYMSPFMLRKVTMSNAFWYGFGAVWNRKGPDGQIVERIALPSDCCTVRRDPDGGAYWYDYNVDGVQRPFSNYELSFLYFETYDGIRGRGCWTWPGRASPWTRWPSGTGRSFIRTGHGCPASWRWTQTPAARPGPR